MVQQGRRLLLPPRSACAVGRGHLQAGCSRSLLWLCGVILKSQPSQARRTKNKCRADKHEENLTVTNTSMRSVLSGALRAPRGQRISSLGFSLASCSQPQQNESQQLPQHHVIYSLAVVIHSRPQLGTAAPTSTVKLARCRRYTFLPALGCAKRIHSSRFCVNKINTKSTDRHHQTQRLRFLQDPTQGRQPKQDFLRVLVCLKYFYIIFLMQKEAARAFSSPCATPQSLLVSTHLSAAGLPPSLCPARGCKVSTDPSSADNQVR